MEAVKVEAEEMVVEVVPTPDQSRGVPVCHGSLDPCSYEAYYVVAVRPAVLASAAHGGEASVMEAVKVEARMVAKAKGVVIGKAKEMMVEKVEETAAGKARGATAATEAREKAPRVCIVSLVSKQLGDQWRRQRAGGVHSSRLRRPGGRGPLEWSGGVSRWRWRGRIAVASTMLQLAACHLAWLLVVGLGDRWEANDAS